MSEAELNPCPYPCGWEELDSLIVKNVAWFARRTADDDVPDEVREVGINLGLWARELCEFSRDNPPRPAVQRDVAGLVEALERIKGMDSMSYHSLESAKIVARAALAAYRKGAKP